ncbi:CrpP-related protein [Rhizobium sp. BK251]|uniref:CrpP-related protein n=1 Tax=Rhizobium sp. BK251 TaxID=2512125 RepID=UPI00104A03E1|nr:CrpP-related protein [Rhizobium sp. BK251]
MTIEEMIDLQERGARARAIGLALSDNPFLTAGHMPVHGREPTADWLARHDAWKFGWEAEHASREGKLPIHSTYHTPVVFRSRTARH